MSTTIRAKRAHGAMLRSPAQLISVSPIRSAVITDTPSAVAAPTPAHAFLEADHPDLCASCLLPLALPGPHSCAHSIPFRRPKRLALPEFAPGGPLSDASVFALRDGIPVPIGFARRDTDSTTPIAH